MKPTDWQGSALISPCGQYRYRLRRMGLSTGSKRVLFVMLNPSTADASVDDPTIRRCIGFARSFGCERLDVVNLFAWRATDPSELRRVRDPIGPENDAHIREAGEQADLIVCAWGANDFVLPRLRGVLDILPRPLHCLGVTKYCAPRHPLYVPAAAQPIVWKAER